MEEKKLNDTDIDVEMIIKTLECMAGITQRDCDSCPFMVDKFCSDTELSKATLDLIHRLQAENATLKSNKFASWKIKFFNLKEEFDKELNEHKEFTKKANAEIERLTEENLKYSIERGKILAEKDDIGLRLKEKQKQVDELTEKNKNLKYSFDTANRYIRKLGESCETNCKKFNGITTQQAVKFTAKEIFDWLKSEVIMTEIPHGSEPCEEDVEAVMWWQIQEHFKKRYGVEVE